MIRNRRILFAAGVLFVSLFGAVRLQAAEEGGNAATETAAEIFRWINFAIVAGVIVWVFGKKLPSVFKARAEAVSSAITSATSAKAAADAQLREAEAGIARLPQDSAATRATATREFATESEHLREGTEREVTRIELAAKAEVSAAQRAARLEFSSRD